MPVGLTKAGFDRARLCVARTRLATPVSAGSWNLVSARAAARAREPTGRAPFGGAAARVAQPAHAQTHLGHAAELERKAQTIMRTLGFDVACSWLFLGLISERNGHSLTCGTRPRAHAQEIENTLACSNFCCKGVFCQPTFAGCPLRNFTLQTRPVGVVGNGNFSRPSPRSRQWWPTRTRTSLGI